MLHTRFFQKLLITLTVSILSFNTNANDKNNIVIHSLSDAFESRNLTLDNSSDTKRLFVYVNGMLTNPVDADTNFRHISSMIRARVPSLVLRKAYNQSQGFVKDVAQVAAQQLEQDNAYTTKDAWYHTALNFLTDNTRLPITGVQYLIAKADEYNSVSESDLNNHINNIYVPFLDAGYHIVVLSHSQGNFYANSAWEQILAAKGLDVARKMKIVGVATPAAYVANDGDYVTNSGDLIINAVRFVATSGRQPKESNISIAASSKDKSGHSLITTYMGVDSRSNDSRETIVNAVVKAFAELESEEEEELDACDAFIFNIQGSERHSPPHSKHDLWSSSPRYKFTIPDESTVTLSMAVVGMEPNSNGYIVSFGYETPLGRSTPYSLKINQNKTLTLPSSNGRAVNVYVSHPTTNEAEYEAFFNISATCEKDEQ